MTKKHHKTVLERFMLPNPQWEEGYASFNLLFKKPLGWLFLRTEEGGHHLIRLDRKSNCAFYSASASNAKKYEDYLLKYCELSLRGEDAFDVFPSFFKTPFGHEGIAFALRHLAKVRGFLLLSSLKGTRQEFTPLLEPFDNFIATQVELAYKSFELNNFYETVHPRALALSTMHSVHRVISSSLRLDELLPRIGRLSAQVLKASGCSIMLCDSSHDYLIPHFSFGTSSKFIHKQRVRIGRGLQGKIAKTGDFHRSKSSIAVPFIEEDVVGVITLWGKVENQPFTKTDLEILKSLSEQAVVAIKNAQLFEETERLTLGSIQTINELLELTVRGNRVQLTDVRDIVVELGKALELSGRELTQLQRAVLLLDTGALTFPEQIWRKKGKLTKKEFQLIKRMPMRGASLLKSISSLKPVIPIVLHYRERYDGKGYPAGLKGEEIPIGARIVSVVDSYVAMTSKRSYREPRSLQNALKELKANRGTQFDPYVVDAFLKLIEREDIRKKFDQIHAGTKKA